MRTGIVTLLAVMPDASIRTLAQSPARWTRTLPQAVVLTALWLPFLLSTGIANAQTFHGYYELQTRFLEGESRCLEGNHVGPRSTLDGAAFMDLCRDVSGQYWKVVPARNGYFRLQSMLREKQNKCLEGNRPGGATLGGVAFLDICKEVDGQLWRIESTWGDYFRLETKFSGKENRCLEGNRPGGSRYGGAAFMDRCENVAGQQWRFVSRCTAKPREGWPKCRSIAVSDNTPDDIKIYGTSNVSEAAMDMVRLIYAAMTSRFTAQYPQKSFKGYEVYITNGEPWKTELSMMVPLNSMYHNQPDKDPDYLRGGTNNDFLWISEQMICRTGVKTRGDKDDTTRTFDQVIHEFAHAIDLRFDLGSEIDTVFRNGQQSEEAWAWAVQYWFGAPPLPQGGGFTVEVSKMLNGLFTSQRSFSCQQYRQWN